MIWLSIIISAAALCISAVALIRGSARNDRAFTKAQIARRCPDQEGQ